MSRGPARRPRHLLRERSREAPGSPDRWNSGAPSACGAPSRDGRQECRAPPAAGAGPVLGIPERSALPRCVRSIQWIRSDRWVVAGSRGLSVRWSRSGGGDKHADESPSRRRGPRAPVSISVSPIGATRAQRRGTRPRVALTLSSLADCKRERLAWRAPRRSSGRGDRRAMTPLRGICGRLRSLPEAPATHEQRASASAIGVRPAPTSVTGQQRRADCACLAKPAAH
jgi:hypothetical protein